MKKILSIILSVSLVLGMGTGALADGHADKEVQKAYKLIEKTNKEIAHKIDKAVNEADKLQAKYYKDILKLQKKEGVAEGESGNQTESKMNEDQGEELFTAAKHESNYDHFLFVEDETKASASILASENEVCGNLNENEICIVVNDDEKVNPAYKELTDNYLEDLNKIILDVYEQTSVMSRETISIVQKVGIKAVCDWVAVDFAYFTVWIDPIRVVGG